MEKEFFVIHNADLTFYNTMRIASTADRFIIPYTKKGLCEAIKEYHDANLYILGNGSNTIFKNKNVARPVIYIGLLKGIRLESGIIKAECGITLNMLSWFALEHSLRGFEYMEDIPGAIGGALVMNAGTYEDNIGSQINKVEVYDLIENKVVVLEQGDLMPFWGKRDSYFQHHECVILSCELNAEQQGDYNEILTNILEIKRKRYEKQPRNYPSAGSVFKRPSVNGQPRYVWQLLSDAGLRGFCVGDAQVSEKHPGFIVNRKNATGEDVVSLMNYCKEVIKEKYSIDLQEEWKIV